MCQNFKPLRFVVTEKIATKHWYSLEFKVEGKIRNLTGTFTKFIPTIWYTKLQNVLKFQASEIYSYGENCDETLVSTHI